MQPQSLLQVPEYFRTIYTATGIWQGVGWSSIIYLAAIAGVDMGLHEAAALDGEMFIRDRITIHFSDGYYSTFTYNASDRLYYKEHSGEPHMVQDTGTQLAFTNVLVLESDITSLDGYRMSINTEGGTGYYISNGVLQEIRWRKATPYDQIQITDEDGNEVAINAGTVSYTHLKLSRG